MSLAARLPWTKSPLIVNAPMAHNAKQDLALAVSRAGGLGLIGNDNNLGQLGEQLDQVVDSLKNDPIGPTSEDAKEVLPVGIGFLVGFTKLETALQPIQKYRPAVVWLFAAHDSLGDYKAWSDAIREASPKTMIWIQIGSSAVLATEVAKQARPDALVVQGSDAGGHGFERGASIVSLVPETLDLLERNGVGDIPVLAAGGIVNARTAAAALVLGASGVVMGTRFLAAREAIVFPKYRERIINAKDGAMATIRAKVFDELSGKNVWPTLYDGRALVSQSWHDWKAGKGMDHVRDSHGKAIAESDMGFGEDSDRAAIWAGAGVGMVHKVQDAADIVEEVRNGVTDVLERAKARL